MNKILLLASVLLLSSCVDADFFDTPVNGVVSGEFDYSSTSNYYDDQGVQYQTNQNSGIIALSLSSEVIVATPYLGWEYEIDITDIETHILEDEDTVYSFSITPQSLYINDEKFVVSGTDLFSLTTDGEKYDGLYYKSGSLYFEIESYNSLSFESVITTTSGTSRSN